MASPSIASVGAGVTTPAGTTLTVVMPSGTGAGDLLICFLFLDQNNPGPAYRSQFPGGWVVLDAVAQASSSVTCQMAYKFLTASESNFNLTTASIISRSRTYRITGHGGSTRPPLACGWQGANAASGPAVNANEWATQDILSILATTWENTTPSGGISGYTNEANLGGGSLGLRTETKAISSVNSEDPAAYTTGSGNRAGYVCLVPSSAADPDLTFPIVRNEVKTWDVASSTTHEVHLNEQREAGDICVVAIGSVTETVYSSGLPSGWTLEVSEAGLGSGGERLTVIWKLLDGTETDFNMTFTSASAQSGVCFCIMNTDSGADVLSASAHNTVADSAPNPPNLSANADLWMAVGESEANAATAFPANYTHKQATRGGSGSVYAAFRQLSATSEDPGAFALGSNRFHAVATLAFGKANPRHFQAWWS